MVKLSHLDSQGRARMVDVGHKPLTSRRAVASALVILERQTLEQVWNGGLEKGDALSVARLAGIQGAKQTSNLIPLCHPLPLDHIAVELRLIPEKSAIRVFAEARTRAATGVEMEALTGAAIAALALIDMVKGVDRSAHIAEVKLEIKEGGSKGRWVREDYEDPFARAEKPSSEKSPKRERTGSEGAPNERPRNQGPPKRERPRNEGAPNEQRTEHDGKHDTHRPEKHGPRRGQKHDRRGSPERKRER